MPLEANLVNAMIGLKNQVISNTGALGSIAVSVAAIGAIVTTVKVFASIMNGQNFSVWQILKPLIVCVLCGHFALVTSTLDVVPNLLTVAISRLTTTEQANKNFSLVEKMLANGKEKQDAADAEVQKNLGIENNDGDNLDEKIENASAAGVVTPSSSTTSGEEMSELKDAQQIAADDAKSKKDRGFGGRLLDQMFGFFLDNIAGMLCRLFTFLMKIIVPFIVGGAQVYLAVLAVLGMFALAFSNFPGLGGFGRWVSRYMHTAFWMPSIYLVNYLFHLGLVFLTSNVEYLATLEGITTRAGAIALYSAICLYMCFQVPTIASYVVESAGVGAGALGNKAVNAGKAIVRTMAGGPAGAAAGAAASSVKGVVK